MYIKEKTNKIVFFISLLLLLSCDNKSVFDQYKSLPNGSWESKEKISFDFEIKDSLSKRNLFINLRNNNKYPFSNLFLITKMKFPDGYKIIDTLEYDMTDKRGNFLGQGFTQIKENKLLYKEKIKFTKLGMYNIEISQSMRKSGEIKGVKKLDGITDVGFRIEKIL